ncbi:MAG: hypothetical protein VXW65_13400 [Pseudomonadota bacterium]|nr:hypothetical protein [Pseudomonadota bacterium]
MKIFGASWSLDQQQRGLRYSFLAWLVWVLLVIPAWRSQTIMSAADAWGLALLAGVPLVGMLSWVWPAKHGNMLMLVGMVWFIYFTFALLAALQGGVAAVVFGIEALLIFSTFFWLMWVVERLPKLH